MTQEDKQLLLQDLRARLPYGVKFLRESWNYEWDQELSVIEVLEEIINTSSKNIPIEEKELLLKTIKSRTKLKMLLSN